MAIMAHSKSRMYLGLLLCLLPCYSQATENSTADQSAKILDSVTVWGRGIDTIGIDLSASQGTVGYLDFEFRPLLRTGEILETIPGVIATQHSGEGKANQFFLRGFNLDHGTDFAGFVDKVPVNMRSHGHGQGYLDYNFMIPELLERVDYRKGPYFADVGDFSAAGAASMITVDSLPAPIASLTLGESGYLRAMSASSGNAAGGEWLGGVAFTTDDGPWELDSELSQISGLLKFHSKNDQRKWGLQLGGYNANWNSTDQVPLRAIEQGLIGRFGNLDPDLGGETHRYWLAADAEMGNWTFNAYAVDYFLNLTSNFTYYLDDPINGDEFQQRDERWLAGFQVVNRRELNVVKYPTVLKIGTDLRYDNIGKVGLYHSVDGIKTETVREDSVDELSSALFVQAETQWTDSLRTMLGVRADYYDYDVNSSIDVNSGSGGQAIVAPKATIAWRVADDVELYGNYGGGFHSNDARGAAISVDPKTLEPAEPVDLLVRAEGTEIGVRYAGPRFNTSLAVFWLSLDSELLFVGDGGTTEPNPASKRYGVEFSGFWRPTDDLTLDLTAAWTDAQFSSLPDDQNRIPGSIESVLAAGATYGFTDRFTGTLRARHFGSAPLLEDGSVSSEATTLLNAGLYYSWDRVRLSLDVYNLLDSEDADISYYYPSRLPGEPAEGVDDIHIHPVEPRQVRIGVSVTF
jgi:outer membrane receptor protein involved in Fe transport